MAKRKLNPDPPVRAGVPEQRQAAPKPVDAPRKGFSRIRFVRHYKHYRKGETLDQTGGVCRTLVATGAAEWVYRGGKKSEK